MNLTRREAIVRMAIMMGATAVGPRLLARNFGSSLEGPSDSGGRTAAGAPAPFSAEEIALLDEIGDTIIPPSDVPGAKAIGIGAFMAMMITDCYYPAEQTAFHDGLRALASGYEAKYHETFVHGVPANRTAFLDELDKEQQAVTAQQKERKKFIRENASTEDSSDSTGEVPHFFRMMKDLTLLGYFTSEVAQTEVLGWIETPGRFDGNVAYVPRQAKA